MLLLKACRHAFGACRIFRIPVDIDICSRSAYEKRSIFTACGVVGVVRTQILIAAHACGFEVIAYCFMPDHVHLVAHGVTEAASLPDFMQRAKQRSGYYGKRVIGHAVWQPGSHDRVLRSEADTPAVVAYVLANPVRAGLVEKPGDYAFSGFQPELKLGPTKQPTEPTQQRQSRPEL